MTRMNILYVNPGKIQAGLDCIIKGPPLALLTIAATVPEHKATLFDFKVDDYNEDAFRALLRKHQIVAITSMTPQIDHALEVAKMAKEQGCITIIGGYHPTLMPEYVAADLNIDFCVRGEGEHTFREIVHFIDSNPQHIEKKDILGVSWRNDQGEVVHNTDRPLEPNLDVFPIPRWDLLQGKKYQYLGAKVNLCETSRGCPHKCAFCCIIKMWKDPNGKMVYRKKSVKRVIEEVYTIYKLKGQKWDFIFFNDDNFTIDVKHTNQILDALIKSRMNKHFFFSCQTRVDTLHRNQWLAPKMAQAGFRMAFLGIESVNQQSLDAMNKRTTIEMIKSACKMVDENGIAIFAGIIVGFPGETTEMVRKTIKFVQEIAPPFVQFTPITAFPGTPFFEEMKQKGRITTFNWKYYDLFHPMMHTEQLSRVEMYRLVGEAYAKYYMRPAYLIGMLKKMLFNPVYSWYRKISIRWLRQFATGGYNMLRSQGISWDLAMRDSAFVKEKKANSLRNRRKTLLERYEKFKLLLQLVKTNHIALKSPLLVSYVKH